MKEKKPINIQIGQNIKRIRESAGLTQEQLAVVLDLGDKHVSAIERGAVGVSLPTLARLCTALGVSADRVLFGPAAEQDARAAALHLMTERLEHLPERQFWAVKDVVDAVLSAMDPSQPNQSHNE